MKAAVLTALLFFFFTISAEAQFTPSGKLEIHYINVQQGGSTLIIGPNGTRILYDFGKSSAADDIVDYLKDQVGLNPEDGLHYTIISHRDSDHYDGFEKVICKKVEGEYEPNYDVLVANYGPGSCKISPTIQDWLDCAAETTAKEVKTITVEQEIQLGDGAKAYVFAANGVVYGGGNHRAHDENDRSVALLIVYKDFSYILDGDLGAGPEDCTDHQTGQKDIQSHMGLAIRQFNLLPYPDLGVDIMHVAHHGAESSTSAQYFNLMSPDVAIVSVGPNQHNNYCHPRVDVVEGVLLSGDNRATCVTAPPVWKVYQADYGKVRTCGDGETSEKGTPVGDVKVVTDGESGYEITFTNRLFGSKKVEEKGLEVIF